MALNTDKLRKRKSLFSTTLSSSITDSDVTIPLSSASGLPTDTAITLTIDRVDANGVSTPAKVERITGVISGNNLTVALRAQDDTSAAAHDSGAVVEDIWDADTWNDSVDGVLAEHNQDGTHADVGLANSIDFTTGHNSDGTHKSLLTAVTSYTPAGAATASLDLTDGNIHKITMPAGNITIACTGEVTGQCFIIELTQDGTGSRTVTWFDTIKWADGSAPTLTTTASKKDTFGFRVTGADTYDGYVVGQNL